MLLSSSKKHATDSTDIRDVVAVVEKGGEDEEKGGENEAVTVEGKGEGEQKEKGEKEEENAVIIPIPISKEISSWVETPFQILESYFENHHLERLVRHQIESFNHFSSFQLQRTIQMFNPIMVHSDRDFNPKTGKYALEVAIQMENFKIYPPQIHENNGATKLMFPQEARLRNFTYSSTMTLDLHIKYILRDAETGEPTRTVNKVLPKINIGKLPIMLKSSICLLTQNKHLTPQQTGECKYDCGGYFIINGSEKTVLAQERAAENKIYCFRGDNTTKWSWYAEIKSVPDFKCISPKQIKMLVSYKSNGFGHGIFIQIPRVKVPLELFIVFRAMGAILKNETSLSDKAICDYILLDSMGSCQTKLRDFLRASIIDGNKCPTQDEALKYITGNVSYIPMNMDRETGQTKKRDFALDVLSNDLFPHCKTPIQKMYFMGYMAKVLIQRAVGWMRADDRDSYVNKRLDLTGTLLNNLFRNYLNKLVKEMQKQIIREINGCKTDDYENIINMINIYKILKPTTIENGIKRALSTGDFSIKQSNSSKVGVAQVLNRLTYAASLSHLRRVNTPFDKSNEIIEPRKLHNTTWGFLCCLTGDTEILLSNRMDCIKIKDIRDGNWVTTVHRKSLLDEPSPIYQYFSRMPDQLYEITTISGRRIKATADHPFLVKLADGTYEMKKVEDLKENDKMIIRHVVSPIPDKNTTELFIEYDDSVPQQYQVELMEHNLINTTLRTAQLKIIARLIGALNTDGNGNIYRDGNYYRSSFCFDKEQDEIQIHNDIQKLGFGVSSSISTGKTTWKVSNHCAFSYLMYRLGGFVGEKNEMTRDLPDWVRGAEPSIKREFLSAFQGRNGSKLSYQKRTDGWKPCLGSTNIDQSDTSTQSTEYLTKIVNMFAEFKINSHLRTTTFDDDGAKQTISIVFEQDIKNLVRYSDIINYTYCDEKRRKSAPVIEDVKIRANRDGSHGVTDILYEQFIKDNIVDNGCISVPILSICEIEPELVYDFTTKSENHSFVASSFVCSNCPETPEGQSIGVVKNLSYMTHVTIPSNSSALYEYVEPYLIPLDAKHPSKFDGLVKIFVNGTWLGVTTDPMGLFTSMKEKKHSGVINIYTSVVFNFKIMELRICNDGGRLTRPILRVENNKLLLTEELLLKLNEKEIHWNDLCSCGTGVIEYVDPEEQDFVVMLAMTPKDLSTNIGTDKMVPTSYTHCEIHPSTMFGVLASCIPFPEHNQSPRNCYQVAMSKQSMGMYATNYDQRMDKTAYVLTYPMRPLVDTRLMSFIKLNEIPAGNQVIVAIMSYTGYNQEDSVLVNQGSVDRGMFLTTIYHTEKDENKKINGDEQIRCRPDATKTKNMKFGNYDKVNAQGFMPENTFVENSDIIISKVLAIKENRNDPTKVIKYEDQSRAYKTAEETYVDKNYMGRNGDGYNFAKVRMRTLRKPVIGDKFASRSAQVRPIIIPIFQF